MSDLSNCFFDHHVGHAAHASGDRATPASGKKVCIAHPLPSDQNAPRADREPLAR